VLEGHPAHAPYTVSAQGFRYSRLRRAAARSLPVMRSAAASHATGAPDRYDRLPRIAALDDRWPISISQIGAWRDLMQSTKLRACVGLSGLDPSVSPFIRSSVPPPVRRCWSGAR